MRPCARFLCSRKHTSALPTGDAVMKEYRPIGANGNCRRCEYTSPQHG